MNIYEKLNNARIEFQEFNIRMSGKNNFSGYSYYELSDIIPIVNRLAKKYNFTCVVSFDQIAILNFIDTEKPSDFITFHSPMSTASLKGCHEVQNLGAVETYIRRYLYQTAFEIVEADELNKNHNLIEEQKKPIDDIIKAFKTSTPDKLQSLKDRWNAIKNQYSQIEIEKLNKEINNV